jgi:hypothetical protein
VTGRARPTAIDHITATFDNVYVNGTLYDDFAADSIDPTKWVEAEVVRRLEQGRLTSALTQRDTEGSNTLRFIDSAVVKAFQAEVAVLRAETGGRGPRPTARLVGAFYNDGTPGEGQTGDILAEIGISHNGAGLDITCMIGRCENSDCTVFTPLLVDDTTFDPVALGETRTLSLAWEEGHGFTCGVDDQTVTVAPPVEAPVLGPARVPFKGMGTHVRGIINPEDSAAIVATFDNVFVDVGP